MSRRTSTTGSIQPPRVGRRRRRSTNDRAAAAASATSRARADRKAPAPGSTDEWIGSGSTTSPGRPGQQDGGDVRPGVEAAERMALASREDRPGPLGERRGQAREPVRSLGRQSADSFEDPLDVVGGFTGLQHRDGDVDERLERRQGLDGTGRIDRRRACGRGSAWGARRSVSRSRRGVRPSPPSRLTKAGRSRALRCGDLRQAVGDRRARPRRRSSSTSFPMRAIAARWTSADG